MDLGIFEIFKKYDRQKLFRYLGEILAAEDTLQNAKVTLSDAALWIKAASEEVSPADTATCFKKAGFYAIQQTNPLNYAQGNQNKSFIQELSPKKEDSERSTITKEAMKATLETINRRGNFSVPVAFVHNKTVILFSPSL
jgi:hypothetical protein